ncbi:MAG: ZIP family metal transporter [archaeon]
MLTTIGPWPATLCSVIAVSLISLIGIFTLGLNRKFLNSIIFLLVSFAVGTLIGDVFIHLLPEIAERGGLTLQRSFAILAGILLFFLLEKVVHWRHCHQETTKDHPHPVGVMNLVGDGLHNFIDGMVIAGSYIISMPIGIATTLAVIIHEIPQEIGDFGILIHAGYSRGKALVLNFLSALLAVLGAVLGLLLASRTEQFAMYIIPFTAGGFIYIAVADLIPELHKTTKPWKSMLQLLTLLAGIGIMMLLLLLE